MAPFKTALGFSRKPVKMMLGSSRVAIPTRLPCVLNEFCSGALVVLVAVFLLRFGNCTLQVEGALTDLMSSFRLGLGNVDFNTLVNFLPHAPVRATQCPRVSLDNAEANHGSSALYANTFFANLWQMIISLLY